MQLITNTLRLDLIPDYLLGLDPPVSPLIAGDEVRWRFQVLDPEGRALSLEGARIAMSILKHEDDDQPAMVRSSNDAAQIAIDGDQTTESVDADGNPIGKGWFTVVWMPAEEDDLLELRPSARYYDIRIRFPSGSVRSFLRGRVAIVRRLTPNDSLEATP